MFYACSLVAIFDVGWQRLAGVQVLVVQVLMLTTWSVYPHGWSSVIDSGVKTLPGSPVLATTTLSGAVDLVGGVCYRITLLLFSGLFRVKTLDSFGSGDGAVLSALPS